MLILMGIKGFTPDLRREILEERIKEAETELKIYCMSLTVGLETMVINKDFVLEC